MSNIKAPSAFKTQYNGTHGNASRTELGFTCAATPIATVIELGRFAAGVAIDELRLIHGALGAGVTVDLGVLDPQGEHAAEPDAFGNFDVAAAGTKLWQGVPKRYEHDVMLIATVKGAAATGRLDLVVEYRNRGNGMTVA